MQEHEPKVTMQIRPNPAPVADPGRVRIGGESPSFGPVTAPIRSSTRRCWFAGGWRDSIRRLRLPTPPC
jgi:hypothetical protein